MRLCRGEAIIETRTTEIAHGIYRLSTHVTDIAPPAGFTFNQFLILADQPLLFHCGPRSLFPLVSSSVAALVPLDRLRWISFGHIEADECGAMNLWLEAAPHAQVVYSPLGCNISVNDLADRPPRAVAEEEVLDLGGKRVRFIPTPHVPHGWEAQVLYEETTATLFCGDVFTQVGDGEPVTESNIVPTAMAAEDMFGATSITPLTAPTLRKLAELAPALLAIMHGSSFRGDGAGALRSLADEYERRLNVAPVR